jgi:hypothetical protein
MVFKKLRSRLSFHRFQNINFVAKKALVKAAATSWSGISPLHNRVIAADECPII